MPVISFEDILDARKAVAPFVRCTPLKHSRFLSKLCGGEVWLKLENLQVTNSFKPRGAFNKLLNLSAEEKARIVTASAGNHGLAVAYAAKMLKFPVTIVVPEATARIKIVGMKEHGAEVVLFGETYDEAERKAKQLAAEDKCVYVSPYNDKWIVAGHGTVGLEIIEALPSVDVVIVPVGGGGLISGVSIAVKSVKAGVQLIGVQSEASPVMYESLRAGRIVETRVADTVAEGLSGGIEEGAITFRVIQDYVDKVLLVSEETIRRAMYFLWAREKQVAEGSGAAAVAPILGKSSMFAGKTVVAVVTGGNIDAGLFRSIVAASGKVRGLA
ncbi:MAG: pyridoxal-phosphate dependent enzyme [Candidatus Bathyarchaeota archaeon]|nr:pyridoxal-phosphate dependent enzyme [Candidatus Bathyarchaeota archaeon]